MAGKKEGGCAAGSAVSVGSAVSAAGPAVSPAGYAQLSEYAKQQRAKGLFVLLVETERKVAKTQYVYVYSTEAALIEDRDRQLKALMAARPAGESGAPRKPRLIASGLRHWDPTGRVTTRFKT